MAESILSLHSRALKPNPFELSSPQKQAEILVSGFMDQATDGYSLAGMVAGGLAYRLGRLGTMAVGSRLFGVGAYGHTPLQLLSIGVGFAGEVFAFEAGQRALRVGIDGADPALLNWSGENGLGHGLMGAAMSLGPLKGAGVLVQGQNPIIRHLFQDSAMVLAHNASAAIGIMDRPTESIAEQFVKAEATLWQMDAGMSLVHGAFPRLGQMERSLDLAIRSKIVGTRANPQDIKSSDKTDPTEEGEKGGNLHALAALNSRNSEELGAGNEKTVDPTVYAGPTIYGIAHDESETEVNFVWKVLEQAHQRGARSVGLEISEKILRNPHGKHVFKSIALSAEKLGMKVIPLENDSSMGRRLNIEFAKRFIGEDGKFNREDLESAIQETEAELWASERARNNPFAAPELHKNSALFKQELDRLESVRDILNEVDYDLDRYAALWHEANIVQANREIYSTIDQQRPDLVFLGFGHAKALSGLEGYSLVDATSFSEKGAAERINLSLEAASPTPSLFSPIGHFKKTLQVLMNRPDLSESEAEKIIQIAQSREPKLARLGLRAFKENDCLIPAFDIEFLKMPMAEAKNKVEQALLAAIDQFEKESGNSPQGPGPLHALAAPGIFGLDFLLNNGQPTAAGILLTGIAVAAGMLGSVISFQGKKMEKILKFHQDLLSGEAKVKGKSFWDFYLETYRTKEVKPHYDVFYGDEEPPTRIYLELDSSHQIQRLLTEHEHLFSEKKTLDFERRRYVELTIDNENFSINQWKYTTEDLYHKKSRRVKVRNSFYPLVSPEAQKVLDAFVGQSIVPKGLSVEEAKRQQINTLEAIVVEDNADEAPIKPQKPSHLKLLPPKEDPEDPE